MAGELDEIVKVTITRQTSAPSMASFSERFIIDMFDPAGITPVFDADHRVRLFGGLSELLDAGFSSASWVYRNAAKQFSQSPHIGKIYVGLKIPGGLYRAFAYADKEFSAGNILHWTVAGRPMPDISFNAEGSHAAMVGKLCALFNEQFGTSAYLKLESGLTLSYYGAWFPSAMSVTGGSAQPSIVWKNAVGTNAAADGGNCIVPPDASWTDALTACLDQNGDWYAVEAHAVTMAEQQEVALWVQANEKLGGIATADPDVVNADTGDIADWLKTNNIDRVFCFYHPDVETAADPFPVSALFGKLLTKHPGGATWALKGLNAVPAVRLTAGQRKKADSKNCMIYTSVASMPITRWGQVGSGEYIDVIHGLDWLSARIQNLVFTPLVQMDKVPFEDEGITTLVDQLRAGLDEGVKYQILKKGAYTIDAPTADQVPDSAKAQRLLPDVKFRAPLSGAIHKTEIDGTITLS